LPQPWGQTKLFAVSSRPLEVEIGTGKGLFLQHEATAKPEANFMGIEISEKYARFAAARLAKRGLENALVVHADARRVFSERLPAESLAAVHVYFPDPWWKKRHHKRRILTAAFVGQIARTLESGGRLHFWTDVEETFDNGLAILATEGTLCGPNKVVPREALHDLDYRTHFERRMRLVGKEVYRAEFVKP
jgi:tRNA (guanine-N7-)-methyltransferase